MDPIRHILHNVIQLSADSLLHFLLRKTGRQFAQSTLHLGSGVLEVLFGRHSGQPLADLLFDHALDVLSGQLVCLGLPDDFLQCAHIENPCRRSRSRGLRAHKISQLLAVALGVLTSLALDRIELILDPTHFAIFRVVVLLGSSP
jgi:hypothetical protein